VSSVASSSRVGVASRRDLLQDAAATRQNAAAGRVSGCRADALDMAGDGEQSLSAYSRSATSSIPTFRYAPAQTSGHLVAGVPEWIQTRWDRVTPLGQALQYSTGDQVLDFSRLRREHRCDEAKALG
jgi:hypothetical protein